MSAATVRATRPKKLQNPALCCAESRQRTCACGYTGYDCGMPAQPDSTGRCVYEVLSASRARLERACTLGDNLRIAQWYNHDDAPRYSEPGHHTISVYLTGGFGTYPTIRPELRGSPGRICILPAEHESLWIVEGDLRFLHLYVSDIVT